MKISRKYKIFFFLTIFVVLIHSWIEAATFIAYSMNEAEKKLKESGQLNAQVVEIGGITNPIALIYDESKKDLILVGQIVRGERRITLDDFVTALRSWFVYGSSPLVSIDKTKDTQTTRKQTIRFEGGIAETQFGMDLLEADILLKKLGLGEIRADIWNVQSYSEMSAKDWEETGEENYIESRFWFVPGKESTTAARQGVAVVKRLKVKVETEVMSKNKEGKRIGCGSFAVILKSNDNSEMIFP